MAFIFGIHPALEALRVGPDRVERVYLLGGPLKGALREVASAAREACVRTEYVSRDRLASLSDGGVHQGVVLRVMEFAYTELGDLLARVSSAATKGLVLVLDGIEDPHNLGALMRSAFAFGAQGIVIPKDRAVGVNATVVKASAGAAVHLAVSRATNLSRALEALKEAGVWVTAADVNGDRPPDKVDFRLATALVIGSEGEGIRPLVLCKCDFRARIPISAESGSLNASVAGAVLLYEVGRQRREESA
jgi:23S rRNA (guanosine2251-2'-O)-methyltransferase